MKAKDQEVTHERRQYQLNKVNIIKGGGSQNIKLFSKIVSVILMFNLYRIE